MAPCTHPGINNGTLYAPRYGEAFLPKGKKRPRSLRSLGLASLLVERYMRQGTARTCSRPCAFEEKKTNKKKHEMPLNTKKTHHGINPQQPGNRDHLETACDETRPTRQPILARFLHTSRVCGIGLACIHMYVYTRTSAAAPPVCVLVLYFMASAASSFSAGYSYASPVSGLSGSA